jgi:hypothetical protein
LPRAPDARRSASVFRSRETDKEKVRIRQAKSSYPRSKQLVSKREEFIKLQEIRQGFVDRALEHSAENRRKRATIRNQSVSIERMCP